jgi:hypothetical protein
MNLRDLDMAAIESQRIRDLQGRFHAEHLALLNWGIWSRDVRGIYPSIARCLIFDNFIHDDTEGWGDCSNEGNDRSQIENTPAKAERSEEEPYDEKSALELNDRINAPQLSECLKRVLRTAYVDGGSAEHRWYVYADCSTPDAFLERLEASLNYVRRWV